MLKRTALLAAVVAVCGVAALPRARGGAAATSQRPAPPPSPGMESVPEDFKLPDAMKTLYGNYDPLAHTSTFRLTKTFPHSFFDKPGKVDARAFLTTGAKDTGAMKVFVLTFGVPHGSPEFDCHACAPVIGAAVFAKKDGGAWAVESANKEFDMLGNWGGPPGAEIVRVGPDRLAFELKPGNTNQGETVGSVMILLPWKGAVREVFDAETISTATSDCGDGMGDCRDKTGEITFVRGADPDYDEIVLTISGTETSAKTGKDEKVRRVQNWKFVDGKYVRVGG
jgi:hypothetical protein